MELAIGFIFGGIWGIGATVLIVRWDMRHFQCPDCGEEMVAPPPTGRAGQA